MNKIENLISNGVNDLSDFFHQIMYSKKIIELEGNEIIECLLGILNTFCANTVINIASKATFIENNTEKQMSRRARMIMLSKDFMEAQKSIFEIIIEYQMRLDNARK